MIILIYLICIKYDICYKYVTNKKFHLNLWVTGSANVLKQGLDKVFLLLKRFQLYCKLSTNKKDHMIYF